MIYVKNLHSDKHQHMIVFTAPYYFIRLVVILLLRLFSDLLRYTSNDTNKFERQPGETKMTATNNISMYVKQKHDEFEVFLQTHEKTKNINMSDCFYNVIPASSDELRDGWYRRILIEFTPNGNIIMYFDPDHFGFMYHSDNSQTYPVLRAVASKYCRIYSCMDLYIDEKTMMNRSPLIDLMRERERNETAQRTGKSVVHEKGHDHDAFVKLKNYSSSSSPIAQEDMKIRFIYLGKLLNLSILRKIERGIVKGTRASNISPAGPPAPRSLSSMQTEECGEKFTTSTTTTSTTTTTTDMNYFEFKQRNMSHQRRLDMSLEKNVWV